MPPCETVGLQQALHLLRSAILLSASMTRSTVDDPTFDCPAADKKEMHEHDQDNSPSAG